MAIYLNSGDSLELWRKTLEFMVKNKGEYDLSTRQMVILLDVYLSDTAFTVKSLSLGLNISKPAVTRALNKLGQIGLIKRKIDTKDKRIVFIQRTVKGSVFLTEFGEVISASAKEI